MTLLADAAPTTWLGFASLLLTLVVVPVVTAVLNRMNARQRNIEARSAECDRQRLRDRAIMRQMMAEFHTIAVIRVNAKGQITEWGPECLAIFRWDAAEMLGQPIDRLLPFAERGRHAVAIADAAAAKRVIADRIIETSARRKGDPDSFGVRVKLNTWVGAGGEWEGVAEVRKVRIAWDDFDHDRGDSILSDSIPNPFRPGTAP